MADHIRGHAAREKQMARLEHMALMQRPRQFESNQCAYAMTELPVGISDRAEDRVTVKDPTSMANLAWGGSDT